MKKTIIALLLTVSIISLVGCSSDNTKKPDNSGSQSQSSQEQVKKGTSTVGKIDKIVGNEISIKLLADNFELTDEMKQILGILDLSQDDLDRLDNGEMVELPNGGIIGAVTPGGEGDGGNNANGDNGSIAEIAPNQGQDSNEDENYDYEAEEKAKRDAVFNKMEFSGESKEFTIKAGTPIVNAVTGENASLSDMKKGSIVTVELDDKGSVVKVVIQY